MFVVLAAMTLIASAQNDGLKTFDGKMFSCLYPAEYVAEDPWMDEVFNAYIEGTPCHFRRRHQKLGRRHGKGPERVYERLEG